MGTWQAGGTISALREKLLRLCCQLEDRLFDLRAGIDTGSTLQERTSHQFGYGYQAVWIRNVRQLIEVALKSGEQPAAFIDIGCGKGKACFYAAGTGKFAQVIGIEVSQALLEKARLNQASFPGGEVRFVEADATSYPLPPVRSLVFMFNPFGEEVMRRFLELNHAVLREHGSLLAYANDVERGVLEENGFRSIYRDAARKLSLYEAC